MLKDRLMWVMHTITFILLVSIFIIQFNNPDLRFSQSINDLVTVAVTYCVLYFILTYGTVQVKLSYDKIHLHLNETNLELSSKANEIAVQNEELLRIQGNLSVLNRDLEKIVNERTTKIQTQNEILIKYSYTNAHHLRGPVARLLGLAQVYKIEKNPDPNYFIGMMVDQAHQIDSVIKQINIDLTLHNVEIREEVIKQN
jgi:signal transduction histidine kinase